jgi:hypothetical protein
MSLLTDVPRHSDSARAVGPDGTARAPRPLESGRGRGVIPESLPYFRTIPRGLLARLDALPPAAGALPWGAVAAPLELLLNGSPLEPVAYRAGLEPSLLAPWLELAREVGVCSLADSAALLREFLGTEAASAHQDSGRDWPCAGLDVEAGPRLVKEGHTASVWLVGPALVTGRMGPGSRLGCLDIARDAMAGMEMVASGPVLDRWWRASPAHASTPKATRTVTMCRGGREVSAVVTLHAWVPGRELRVESVTSGGRQVVARLVELEPRLGVAGAAETTPPEPRALSPLLAARIWRQLISCCVSAARVSPGDAGPIVSMPMPHLERGDAIHIDGRAIIVSLTGEDMVFTLDTWLAYLNDPWLPLERGCPVRWPINGALEPTVRGALEQNPALRETGWPAVQATRFALARAGLLLPVAVSG